MGRVAGGCLRQTGTGVCARPWITHTTSRRSSEGRARPRYGRGPGSIPGVGSNGGQPSGNGRVQEADTQPRQPPQVHAVVAQQERALRSYRRGRTFDSCRRCNTETLGMGEPAPLLAVVGVTPLCVRLAPSPQHPGHRKSNPPVDPWGAGTGPALCPGCSLAAPAGLASLTSPAGSRGTKGVSPAGPSGRFRPVEADPPRKRGRRGNTRGFESSVFRWERLAPCPPDSKPAAAKSTDPPSRDESERHARHTEGIRLDEEHARKACTG